ncbi:MAG: hypothetical protein JW901_05470 [Dehalococcoidia bacterium]|nr:hypothetical protein [Dehalococcoidia bacterium]
MKINVSVKMNLKVPEALAKVKEAARLGVRDTVVDIARDVKNIHPWKNQTGNNMESITMEVSGMGDNQVVDPDGIEGAVYSQSGYGGFLETGTAEMPPFPYFRPALDTHKDELAPNIKKHMP